MRSRFLMSLALVAVGGAAAEAQSPLTVGPESKVVVLGGSNVHDWSCQSTKVEAAVVADLTTPSVKSVQVTIPVATMTCVKGGTMEKNMRKALKADQHTTITFTAPAVTVSGTAQKFTVKAPGTLTLAGQTRPVTVELSAERLADGRIKAVGTVPLTFTGFGLQPPTAMLGAMKVKDQLSISIDLVLAK